jgi:putative hydrolase of the HAD superfamily
VRDGAGRLRAVTFDCWGTLIVDPDPKGTFAARAEALARLGGTSLPRARELLAEAWRIHHDAWRALRPFGSPGMAAYCLRALGRDEPGRRAALVRAFEEPSGSSGVRAVPGAAEALAAARRRGLVTALVCDTGFTPGRVVRRLLAEVGLAGGLDALAFSDEVGAPKPDPRIFRRALDALGVPPRDALHVGDLRRTDVAGARALGMRTVRFAGVNDDVSDDPEADLVIRGLEELERILTRP